MHSVTSFRNNRDEGTEAVIQGNLEVATLLEVSFVDPFAS